MENADLKNIQNKIVPILKDHDVKRSALFGSVVRGEATPQSDVDILVEFKETKGLFEFVALKLKLEEVLGAKVDLLTYNGLSPYLRDRILEEQVPIL